jgi:hypothetical protein
MESVDATRKREEMQLLSEFALCDEQNVSFTLIKHNMVASVLGALRMGQTVRIHRVQKELSSQWYDVKVVKIYRKVELAILKCEIDICTYCTRVPAISGAQPGAGYFQMGFSPEPRTPTFHEGVITSAISSVHDTYMFGSITSASDDQLGGGVFNTRDLTLCGICVRFEKDTTTEQECAHSHFLHKSYIAAADCFFFS